MADKPLIALISAVRASIPPTLQAFSSLYPEAQPWNILDDRLLEDAGIQGGLTDHLRLRMDRLIAHAMAEGASGILLTCSLYASVAHDAATDAGIPVLAPDDAVFLAARDSGYQHVLLVSSGADPLDDSVTRLRAILHTDTHITGVLAESAAPAARSGDLDALVDAVHESILTESAAAEADAVVLGQFSLAPAAAALCERLGRPVLAGPQFAAARLRSLIEKDAL